MVLGVIEREYPLEFRSEDAKNLGEHIKNRHSVLLIGMKRVGISNFLRFFIYHKEIAKTYINDRQNHLFVPVDLNDLVEIEIFPFWMLTLKRIVDTCGASSIDPSIKKQLENLFLDSIQSKDLFLLLDCIRRSLSKITQANYLPTIFFIRFDRMRENATKEFLYNLEGLKDATHNKLSFIFTTYRRLDHLSPKIFNLTSLSLTSNNIYIKPAKLKDLEILAQTYINHYNLKLSKVIKKALFDFVDGFVQYMQLALIILHETSINLKSREELYNLLTQDERIGLQSEELWESLTEGEKATLIKIIQSQKIEDKEKENSKYLWDTGFIKERGEKNIIFSPLFEYFINISQKIGEDNLPVEFSKKELSLFNFLKDNINQVVEREAIIESVWPEEEALGVSDWAIDRLVARVRNKLKKQNNNFEVITIKTRGYKLVSSS